MQENVVIKVPTSAGLKKEPGHETEYKSRLLSHKPENLGLNKDGSLNESAEPDSTLSGRISFFIDAQDKASEHNKKFGEFYVESRSLLETTDIKQDEKEKILALRRSANEKNADPSHIKSQLNEIRTQMESRHSAADLSQANASTLATLPKQDQTISQIKDKEGPIQSLIRARHIELTSGDLKEKKECQSLSYLAGGKIENLPELVAFLEKNPDSGPYFFYDCATLADFVVNKDEMRNFSKTLLTAAANISWEDYLQVIGNPFNENNIDSFHRLFDSIKNDFILPELARRKTGATVSQSPEAVAPAESAVTEETIQSALNEVRTNLERYLAQDFGQVISELAKLGINVAVSNFSTCKIPDATKLDLVEIIVDYENPVNVQIRKAIQERIRFVNTLSESIEKAISDKSLKATEDEESLFSSISNAGSVNDRSTETDLRAAKNAIEKAATTKKNELTAKLASAEALLGQLKVINDEREQLELALDELGTQCSQLAKNDSAVRTMSSDTLDFLVQHHNHVYGSEKFVATDDNQTDGYLFFYHLGDRKFGNAYSGYPNSIEQIATGLEASIKKFNYQITTTETVKSERLKFIVGQYVSFSSAERATREADPGIRKIDEELKAKLAEQGTRRSAVNEAIITLSAQKDIFGADRTATALVNVLDKLRESPWSLGILVNDDNRASLTAALTQALDVSQMTDRKETKTVFISPDVSLELEKSKSTRDNNYAPEKYSEVIKIIRESGDGENTERALLVVDVTKNHSGSITYQFLPNNPALNSPEIDELDRDKRNLDLTLVKSRIAELLTN